jgi:outer membrane protein assembly factor BamB
MPANPTVRHLAVAQSDADLFVTAAFERSATLWSLRQRMKLSEINANFDFGGTRLAILQSAAFCVLAMARFCGPITVCDTQGTPLWSRSDLVEIQQIMPISNAVNPMIGIGLEDKPYRIVDARNGADICALDQIKELYTGLAGSHLLGATSRRSIRLVTLDFKKLWEHRLKSFAVLHGGVSSDQVVYSEASGAVYCFDFTGNLQWEFIPEKHRHVLRVVWSQVLGKWAVVDWNYESGGSKRLLQLDDKGKALLIADLDEVEETEFFANGNYLVTSNGNILDVSLGEVVWNFLDI